MAWAFAQLRENAEAAAGAGALSLGAFALNAALATGRPLEPVIKRLRAAAAEDELATAVLDSIPPKALAEVMPLL